MDRLAVISDIHGNRWALEAVLADVRKRSISEIYNLGDSLYGPLDPGGTAEILIPLNLPTVRGNEDRVIRESNGDHSSPTLQYVRRHLRQDHLDWLMSLVLIHTRDDILLCHGTPASDSDYLLWNVTSAGAMVRQAADVQAMLASAKLPLVLCGHDHVPRCMRLPNGTIVVNPGSVGLPAYTDTQPHPHVMETGSPHARYAILSHNSGEWHTEHIGIPYDWHAAANQALRNGRPDWARWLQTGRASM